MKWSVEPGEDTLRIEVPEIPMEAVREIVVNSFAYADYRGISDKYGVKVESFFENDGFSFVFFRDKYSDDDTKNDTIKASEQRASTHNSIPTEARVYMLLKEDPTQTREILANKTGRTVRTIQRALDKLTADGKIKRIGREDHIRNHR